MSRYADVARFEAQLGTDGESTYTFAHDSVVFGSPPLSAWAALVVAAEEDLETFSGQLEALVGLPEDPQHAVQVAEQLFLLFEEMGEAYLEARAGA